MSASNLMNGLLESLSRCFNPPTGPTTSSKTTVDDGSGPKRAVEPSRERSDGAERQRRTGRVELHDEEWDKLFDADNRRKVGKKRGAADFEMSYGEVVQKSREAAQPARTRQRKSDIFRSREPAQLDQKNTGSVSAFFKEHSQYLCFANPIGENMCSGPAPVISPAVPIQRAQSVNTDDDSGTVDTMTSTQYFDKKHNISGSKAQPMPLFSEFRIDCLDWTSGEDPTMSEAGVEDVNSGQRIFRDFEMKIKASPPRDKQIAKTFMPSADPMDMPEIARLSGSQSTVDESSSFALQKNRSTSSRGSINNNQRWKAKKILPRL